MSGLWVLPSYNRPEQCLKAIEACMATGMTTPGLLIVNGADGRYDFPLPVNWTKEVLPENIGYAQALNHAFREHWGLQWYGLLNDDIFPETEGWDRALIEAAGDKCISHSSDGWQSERRIFGITVFGGELLRAIGWWTLPGTWHCYNDDLYEAIARDFPVERYVPKVRCRAPHAMNKNDRAPWDETYRKAYSRMAEDRQVYERWMKSADKMAVWDRIEALFPAPKPSIAGKSLYIASPCKDGEFCSAFLLSYGQSARKFHQYGVPYEINVLEKCSILSHARNRLCQDFLKSDKTHMLFIDADMGWPDYAPLELLAHDRDVIAVAGVTKELENQKYCVSLSPDTLRYDKHTGLVRVKQVGTGFMMLSRACLERFAKEYAHLAYNDVRNPDPVMPRWFDFDLTADDWGEDYTFCRRWREIGGEIWVDPSIPLHHIGQHAFTGKYSDALKASDERRSEAA